MRTLFLGCSLVLALSSCTVDSDEVAGEADVASIPVDESDGLVAEHKLAEAGASASHAPELAKSVTTAAAATWAPCIGTRLTHCYTSTRCVNLHETIYFWNIWSYWLNHIEVIQCGRV